MVGQSHNTFTLPFAKDMNDILSALSVGHSSAVLWIQTGANYFYPL
jgi:hypothetical protein